VSGHMLNTDHMLYAVISELPAEDDNSLQMTYYKAAAQSAFWQQQHKVVK